MLPSSFEVLGHRLYDGIGGAYVSGEGRFLTRDPAGYAGGENLYAYCGDSPSMFTDPLGLCASDPDYLRNQLLLGGLGMIPGLGEVANGASALYALSNGDYAGAAFAAAALIPIAGEAADAANEARLAEKVAGAAEGDTTRVGRWMNQAEHDAMDAEGRVQPALSDPADMKHVTVPPNPDAFRAAAPGSVFAEFDVPTAQLANGGKEGWGIVFGPNSIYGRLFASRGMPLDSMPSASNIKITARM